MFIRLSIGPLL